MSRLPSRLITELQSSSVRQKQNNRGGRWHRLCSLLLAVVWLGLFGVGEAFHDKLHEPSTPPSPGTGSARAIDKVEPGCSHHQDRVANPVPASAQSDSCLLCQLTLNPFAISSPQELSFAPAPDVPVAPGPARVPHYQPSAFFCWSGRAPPAFVG